MISSAFLVGVVPSSLAGCHAGDEELRHASCAVGRGSTAPGQPIFDVDDLNGYVREVPWAYSGHGLAWKADEIQRCLPTFSGRY